MKITKQQLRRIIKEERDRLLKEMHPRAAADDAYVAELEEKEDELATQIRHASKDIYGTKDHYDLRGKTVEELEDILYDLANSQEQKYLDDEARIEMDDEMGYDSELSRAEMAPRRQGMSRRPGGSKSQRRMENKMRITKDQIRRIVKEEIEQMQAGSATVADLRDWFYDKKDRVKDLAIPAAQIRALIDYFDDGIKAAQAGTLKRASGRLSGIVDKISGE